MRGYRRWLGGILFVAGMVTQRPLLAAVPAAQDPDKDAAGLFEYCVKAARARQWEKARAACLRSFELKPDAKTAANLGRVESIVCRPKEAAEHLSFFLREARDVTAHDRKDTEETLTRVKAKIGTMTIQVDAAGADVFVDGQWAGKSPLVRPVFVEPGSRRIEAKKVGMEPASQKIEVAAGAALVVSLKLPATVQPIVVPVQKPAPSVETPAGTGAPAWVPWALGGVAAAGAGVGIGFLVWSREKDAAASDVHDRLSIRTEIGQAICPSKEYAADCSTLVKLQKTRNTYGGVAIAGFAVGGAAVAGAVMSVLLKPGRRDPSTGKGAALSIVPSPQGVVVSGAF